MSEYVSYVYGFCMDKSALEIDVLKMKQKWQKTKAKFSMVVQIIIISKK